jgi:DNA repair exonuclease SbcCD ATPase subunit
MFEKMKADAWLEGYNKGIDEAEELREMEQQSDDNGITYASHGDYMKAKVAFNAKDTEIAGLKEKVKELEGWKAASNKDANDTEASLAKCRKELEQFYLKAIGDCRTVKQVNAVVKQYTASSIRPTVYGTDLISNLKKFTDAVTGNTQNDPVLSASKTKIKRINRRDTEQVCETLDDFDDENFYVSLMAKTIKDIAGIEVDRTKIIDAKQKGLDAWNVLLSMLSAYGVKADSVLEVK